MLIDFLGYTEFPTSVLEMSVITWPIHVLLFVSILRVGKQQIVIELRVEVDF